LVQVVRHAAEDHGGDGEEAAEDLGSGNAGAGALLLAGGVQGGDVAAPGFVLVVGDPVRQSCLALAGLDVDILADLEEGIGVHFVPVVLVVVVCRLRAGHAVVLDEGGRGVWHRGSVAELLIEACGRGTEHVSSRKSPIKMELPSLEQ